MRTIRVPTDPSKPVSEGSSGNYFPRFGEDVVRVTDRVAVVYKKNAERDHLFENERASDAIFNGPAPKSARVPKDGTKDVDPPRKKVYGDVEVRGWNPIFETFTDVPAHIRPADFEPVERQILDPNT